jgi:hypothetical protein
LGKTQVEDFNRNAVASFSGDEEGKFNEPRQTQPVPG